MSTQRFQFLRKLVSGQSQQSAILAEISRLERDCVLLESCQGASPCSTLSVRTEPHDDSDDQDPEQRARAERMLRSIIEGTARATGHDFFSLLTQHLAQAIGTKFAVLGRLVPPERSQVEALASWVGDGPGGSFVYDLAGTPCEVACGGDLCYFPEQVQAEFPADAMLVDMGVHSYMGTRLQDASGQTLGIIAVLDEKPLAEPDLASEILEVFAARAGAELERALYETEMREARVVAETANQAKTRFLAKMTHEIRTPLNGVLGTADLLSDSELDADQTELLEIIQDAGVSLLSIVNDVLDLSKVETGRLDLKVGELSPASHARDVTRMLSARAGAKGLKLKLTVAPDVPETVLGDAVRIRQVLTNLIGNAVRYTDAGQISIQVSVIGETETGETEIRFEVDDTGPGIPKAHLKRIFESFEQAPTDEHLAGGTGLGLTIARQLVQAMSGQIGVESEFGRGSTFWFTLPLRRTQKKQVPPIPPPQAATEAKQPVKRWIGLRVLLVEDNLINQLIASRLLQQLGCRVNTAVNGLEAIDAAAAGEYDLVFMDSQMPLLNGLEATRSIRTSDSGADIPIVALTANAFREHRDDCLSAGMNDFLTKPVQLRDLDQMLDKWCGDALRDAP